MNTFGRLFRISIYGESHGDELGIVIDGCPPGIPICEEDFSNDIALRAAKFVGTTSRIETDRPHIKSGVYNSFSTGTPINISFKNERFNSESYNFNGFFRPSHADFTNNKKLKGYNNPLGGGHSSGRLTLALVAAGVVAKKIIPQVVFNSKIISIGGEENYDNLLFEVVKKGDSLGGIIECNIKNLPIGLGEPFFDSLESQIAHIVFSIPGAKAIEFGNGIEAAKKLGSKFNDVFIDAQGTTSTNNSGGINGGITNGNNVFFNVFFKPSASIKQAQKTYNFKSDKIEEFTIDGQHDACYVIRTPIIVEAVAAIAIADLLLINKSK